MFKTFFILVATVTMVSMGFFGELGKIKPIQVKAAPMIIGENGMLTFPGRMPSPNTVKDLQLAIEKEDVDTLNALLVENHLFVAPKF